MHMDKQHAVSVEFREALTRLDEVLEQEKNEFMRDSAIKRFEMTFDLSWKAVKAHLETLGVHCASPMGCFREAYKQGIVESYEEGLLSLVETRNRTIHTYDESLADDVYEKLPESSRVFHILLKGLEK